MVKIIPILVSTLALVASTALLGGCGQKGALVLPPKTSKAPPATASAPTHLAAPAASPQ